MSLLSEIKKGCSRLSLHAGYFGDYLLVPRAFHRARLEQLLDRLTPEERERAEARADYYNRLDSHRQPGADATTVGNYRYPFRKKGKKLTTYFFDLYEVVRHFPSENRFSYVFGDVSWVPQQPSFVKSRPIDGDVANAVVLKLNKYRHFRFIDDHTPFRQKRDMLVGRTTWAYANPLRSTLYEKFWGHPLCNVGKTKPESAGPTGEEPHPETVKGFLPMAAQLEYKFIASIEGNDVATNLKWIMSSNSIAVSPKPRFETWFMEGTLKPGYHYIEVKPDYSDLEEKLRYYIDHTDEAEAIVAHAHEYVNQFKNKRIETATQLLVAEKYFRLTST